MLSALKQVDRILRGEATRGSALSGGTIELRAGSLAGVVAVLGVAYGLCMGSFAVVSGKGGGWMQMVASGGKVPALFFLTLAVTFPSLYVFNALVGSRLTLVSLLRLIIAAMSVMLALLASFGTIVAFFSFTTESYPFIVLLNVAVFAVSGLLGLTFLLRTLHRLTLAQEVPMADFGGVAGREGEVAAGALEGDPERVPGANVKAVFKIWIIMFGLVGSQMSWVLRPFIGGGAEFALFRPKGSNFFEAVWHQLGHLMGW